MPLTKGMKRAQNFGKHLKHKVKGKGQEPPREVPPPALTPGEKCPVHIHDIPTPECLVPSQTPAMPQSGTSNLPKPVSEPATHPPQPTSSFPPHTLPMTGTSSTAVVISTSGSAVYHTWLVGTHEPPPRELVKFTISLLEARTNPKRKSGVGHKKSKLNPLALKDLNSVIEFFRGYINEDTITWRQAALNTSRLKGHGQGHARTLCAWGRACILDPNFIPRTSYGQNQDPLISRDEFRKDLETYLRGVGKYVTALDVVRFTSQPSVQATWELTRPVSRATAQRWMRQLSYRWGREPRGLYFDGHERPDVVEYRQKVYLKKWKEMEPRMQSYATAETYTHMDPIIRRIVVWYHDECVFYANDRRLIIWVRLDADHKPMKKGEGESIMVSDLFSAEYGWLRSPDGAERVRVLFRVGINRDGYFSTAHICNQIARAADILAKHYTGEDHVFVFDNSPTHLKRGPDAPSAQQMPKKTPKPNAKNFLVQTSDEDGNEVQVPMTGAYFSDGRPQSLYWPEGHPRAGWFKGMAEILKERGWENAWNIRAKCTKCDRTRTDCCLRRILFNEPDFANPTSILERLVTSRGHTFLLLPKFHPELNGIERVWARAKYNYRKAPESKGDAQLRKNVKEALESVKIPEMRSICTLVRRIVDGYAKGLSGKLAAWAKKRFHGHRVYPENILQEAERALEMKEEPF